VDRGKPGSRAAGPSALFPQPATHRGRLDPCTISTPLPEHWAVPLDELDAPRPQLRRDAAIRVAQMATGRSRRSAALYLGSPLGSLHSATISIRTWQKEPGNASAYRRALHRVAEIAIAQGRAERGGAGGG
jgi:hypothetical protein